MRKFSSFIIISFLIIISSFVRFGEAFCYEEVTGEFHNLAVTVEFKDTEESDEIKSADDTSLAEVFNGESEGLKSYILKNSQSKLTVSTTFHTTVKINKNSRRYMPRYKLNDDYYEEINIYGYDNRNYTEDGEVSVDGNLQSAEYLYREHEFISLVAEQIKGVENIKDFDLDGDGYLDGLTVIPCSTVKLNMADESKWGNMFWPHMSSMYYGTTEGLNGYYYVGETDYDFKTAVISEKTVYKYVIAPFTAVTGGKESVSVICHEFMHLLGAPDYYAYDGGEEYVGEFDIMGTSDSMALSLTYLRERMGWIGEGEILAVEESGDYFLNPTEESGAGEVKAYKIVLSDYFETDDCYYIECRKLSGLDEGIIIYRVNEKNGFITRADKYGTEELGNMYKSPEVYIFRRQSSLKDLKKNAFLDDFLHKKFGSESGNKNLITNSNGENTKITVEVTGKTGKGYNFRVTIPESPTGDITGGATVETTTDLKGRDILTFENSYRKGYAYILITKKTLEGASGEDIISGKFGEAVKVPVSFQKYRLPKANGTTNVYVCLSDGEKVSRIYTACYGLTPLKISPTVIWAGAGLGFGLFIVIVLAVKFLKKG